jgi:uncharacterized protein
MSEKKRPIRTCVACRTSDEKGGLIRLVRGSDGKISIDATGKKPGRGAYVCNKIECVTTAFKKKGLDRALRTAVPAELVEELKKALERNETKDQ